MWDDKFRSRSIGVPVSVAVELMKRATLERPGVYVGEMEDWGDCMAMRLFSGPEKIEIGHIDFTAKQIVWRLT